MSFNDNEILRKKNNISPEQVFKYYGKPVK